MSERNIKVKISADIKDFEKKLNKVEKKIEDIEKAAKSPDEGFQTDNLQKMINEIAAAQKEIKNAVNEISFSKAIGSAGEFRDVIRSINTGINKLKKNIDNITMPLQTKSGEMDSSRVDKLSVGFDKAISSAEKFSGVLTEINDKLSTAVNQAGKLKIPKIRTSKLAQTSETTDSEKPVKRNLNIDAMKRRMSQFDLSAGVKVITPKIKIEPVEAKVKLVPEKQSVSGIKKTADGIFSGFLGGIAKAGLALQGVYLALNGIKDIAASIVMPGFELATKLETTQLGIAGILTSMTTVNGEALKFSDAMGISANVMKKIQQDAIRTSASVGDLTDTFRAILAPGLSAGMNIDEIQRFSTVGVNAVKAMGLESNQFVQELRDLVQGGIQASSSTLATSLGLTDADIKEAKASSEGLFKFLMARMEGLVPMAEAFPDTMTGKLSILKETATYASKEITDAFESEIINGLTEITELIADVDSKTGEMQINPEIIEFIDELRTGWYELCAFLDDALPRQSTQFDDIVWVLRDLWDIAKNVTLGIMDFLRVLANSDIVKYFVHALRLLTNELNYLSDVFAKFYDNRSKTMGYKKDNAAAKMKEEADKENKQRQDKRNAGSDIDPNSLKPKFGNEDAAKNAQDKMIKDSQKALKAQLEEVKNFYDKQLAVYKNSLDKLNVALQDNQISFTDAALQELQIKRDMEQSNIDRINAQIEKVSNALYKDEADRNRELSKLTNELSKHTTALDNQTNSINGMNSLLDGFSDVMGALEGRLNGNSGNSNKQPAGNAAQIIDSNVDGGWGAAIVAAANKYGVDPMLAAAVMQAESKGNAGAVSGVGAIGLMQLMPSTAAGLGVDAYDPQQNIEGGVKYLKELIDTFGDNIEKVVAGYNAGSQAVKDYGGIPPYTETQNYVKEVTGYYDKYSSQVTAGSKLDTAKIDEILKSTANSFEYYVNSCADFVSKGLTALYGDAANTLLTVNVPNMVTAAGDMYKPSSSGYKPKPGDVVVYNEPGDDNNHVGIYVGDGINYDTSSTLSAAVRRPLERTGMNVQGYISTSDLGSNVPSLSKVSTQENLQLKKELMKALNERVDTSIEFGEIFGDGLRGKLEKIDLTFQDRLEKLEVDLKAASKRGDTNSVNSINAQIDEIGKIKENLKSNAELDNYLKKLNINLKQIEVNGEERAEEIGVGLMDLGDMASKYYSYISDTGQYALGKTIEQLKTLRAKYEQMGNISKVQEIDAALRNVKSTIDAIIDKFVDAINKNAQLDVALIENSFWHTTGQKERAKQKIEADKHRKTAEADKVRLNALYAQYDSLLATDTEKASKLRLETIIPLEKTIQLNEEMAKTPLLMERVRQSSKQALEDGLTTFLTDGITQAENLKDALLDLVETILKAIQKEFADDIVGDLMDKWYPQKEQKDDTKDNTSTDTAAVVTNFETIVSDFNGFNMRFTQEINNFVVKLQGAFQQILQSIQSASNMIPDFSSLPALGGGGGYDFGSGNVWDGFADGGFISGAGTETSDSIPAMLSNGEFVVRAKAVRSLISKYGRNFMDNLNSGRIDQYLHTFRVDVPKFATGGYVGKTGMDGASKGMENFAAMIGTEVNPNVHVNNYVDGKRIFDEYGAPLVRSITKQEVTKNAKLYSEVFKRSR